MNPIRPLSSIGASGTPDAVAIPNTGGTFGISGIIDTPGISGTNPNATDPGLNASTPCPDIVIPDLKSPNSIIDPTIPSSSLEPLDPGSGAAIPHPSTTMSGSNLDISEPRAPDPDSSLETAGPNWDIWINLG